MLAVYLMTSAQWDWLGLVVAMACVAVLGAFTSSGKARKLLLVGLVLGALLYATGAFAVPYKPNCETCLNLWPAWICHLQQAC